MLKKNPILNSIYDIQNLEKKSVDMLNIHPMVLVRFFFEHKIHLTWIC
jgi:hypothetical protein